jgi:hypothetical protein
MVKGLRGMMFIIADLFTLEQDILYKQEVMYYRNKAHPAVTQHIFRAQLKQDLPELRCFNITSLRNSRWFFHFCRFVADAIQFCRACF